MKKTVIFTVLVVFLTSSLVFSFLSNDNKTLLDELKSSAMHVVDLHQKLFNTDQNGTVTDKGLGSDWFGKESYMQFKKMATGQKWNIRELKGSDDPALLGQALSTYLAAARIVVARSQKKINTDSDGTVNPTHFYPAVFGRLTADEFYSRTGIKIKQTTTGKGYGARNSKYNSPDGWEKSALAKFESAEWERTSGVGEMVPEAGKKYYRYMQPLEIKQACLTCHGDPRGEKDISGHIKEGYQVNDIRGGISVKIPVN
jgi:hypothetical protein